jgi:hypothetical protein
VRLDFIVNAVQSWNCFSEVTSLSTYILEEVMLFLLQDEFFKELCEDPMRNVDCLVVSMVKTWLLYKSPVFGFQVQHC